MVVSTKDSSAMARCTSCLRFNIAKQKLGAYTLISRFSTRLDAKGHLQAQR